MGVHRQQREVFDMLRELSGQDRYLVVPRILVRLCGGWEEAAMLSQILYWSHPDKRDGWFYKTREDWSRELEITEKQVRRCRANLELLGFIETKVLRVANSPATWYRPAAPAILKAYEKHRPKWADHRPLGAAAPALEGQSSISPKYNTRNARAREVDDYPLSPEEKAEWDRMWDEVSKKPFGQMFLGFMNLKGGDE